MSEVKIAKLNDVQIMEPAPPDFKILAPGDRHMAIVTPAGDVLVDWPTIEMMAEGESAGNLAKSLAKLMIAIRDKTYKPLHITGTMAFSDPLDALK